MRREKMVGAGKQYAPTLYTVPRQPRRRPAAVRLLPHPGPARPRRIWPRKPLSRAWSWTGNRSCASSWDDSLKHGKFEIIAEAVAAPIIAQLRDEEMQRYGLSTGGPGYGPSYAQPQPYGAAAPAAYGYDQGFSAAAAYGYDQPAPAYDPLASDAPIYDDYAYDEQPGAQQDYLPNEFDGPLGYDGLPLDAAPAVSAADFPGAPAPAATPGLPRRPRHSRSSARGHRRGSRSRRGSRGSRSRRRPQHRGVRRRRAGRDAGSRAKRRAGAPRGRLEQPRLRPGRRARAHRTRVEERRDTCTT